MTQQVESQLIEADGESRGKTKYRQLKEMLRIADLLSRDRMSYIPVEIIKKISQFNDVKWAEILKQYRETTTALVKMNKDGLTIVRTAIAKTLE